MIESIVEKLSVFNIKNIVSIDNDWGGREDRKQLMNIDMKGNIFEFFKVNNIVATEPERLLINKKRIKTFEELMNSNETSLSGIQRRLQRRVESTLELEPTLEPTLESLNKVLKKIENLNSNLNIFKEKNSELDLEKYKGNSLYILDKNMGLGNEDIIVEKILEIKARSNESSDLILIYSSECGSDFNTHKDKLEYLNKKYVDNIDDNKKITIIYQLWAINKVGNDDELARYIDDMLSKSMYGTSLNNILNFKMELQKKAYNDLLKIDIENLEGAFEDSFIEGDNLISSFDRIILALTNKNHEDTKNFNQKSEDSIKFLLNYEKSKINSIKDKVQQDNCYEEFKNEHARKKLLDCTKNYSEYAIGNYLNNKFYGDISTGDLFKFQRFESDSWEYGMVISQECNNVVRMPIKKVTDSPYRENKEFKLLLFKADEIPSDTITNSKLSALNRSISTKIWPIKIDDRYYSLSPTENSIIIESNILDLCSLNNKGKAIIDKDIEEALKFKGYQSEKYFKGFYNNEFWRNFNKGKQKIGEKYIGLVDDCFKECSSTLQCDEKCNEKEVNNKKIENSKQIIYEMWVSLKYGINYSDDEFKIERICRIEPKRTLLAIQDYVYKISRPGAEPVIANSVQ